MQRLRFRRAKSVTANQGAEGALARVALGVVQHGGDTKSEQHPRLTIEEKQDKAKDDGNFAKEHELNGATAIHAHKLLWVLHAAKHRGLGPPANEQHHALDGHNNTCRHTNRSVVLVLGEVEKSHLPGTEESILDELRKEHVEDRTGAAEAPRPFEAVKVFANGVELRLAGNGLSFHYYLAPGNT